MAFLGFFFSIFRLKKSGLLDYLPMISRHCMMVMPHNKHVQPYHIDMLNLKHDGHDFLIATHVWKLELSSWPNPSMNSFCFAPNHWLIIDEQCFATAKHVSVVEDQWFGVCEADSFSPAMALAPLLRSAAVLDLCEVGSWMVTPRVNSCHFCEELVRVVSWSRNIQQKETPNRWSCPKKHQPSSFHVMSWKTAVCYSMPTLNH